MAPSSSVPVPRARPRTISQAQVVARRAPKLTTNKTSALWRSQRRARAKRTLTAGDRVLQAKNRVQRRQEYRDALHEVQGKIYELARNLKDRFGKYSIKHYHNDIIQRAHKSRSTRKVNIWNAFLKQELKRMKDENPDGVNLTAVVGEISKRWKLLSGEDRVAMTTDSIQEIEDEREAKNLAPHNVPLWAFHDARNTIQTVEKELSQLHARTGYEFLLMACRSNTKDFMKPFVYYSSEVVKQFVADSLNRPMDDLVVQLESYVVTGLKGVVMNSKLQTLELKRKVTALILEKLRTITGTNISRMEYDRFDELITARYRVVVKDWPLKTFCNPSNIGSRIQLDLLYNAWHSGETSFKMLTDEEMQAWEGDRFSSRIESMGPHAEPVPALSSAQTTATEMTLFSEPPRQDPPALMPSHPAVPTQNAPLVSVMNLSPRSTPTSAKPRCNQDDDSR